MQDKIGLTFGMMLRALLRQDPDVIMLGEMRDAETTNIALQASITGHLVLSTMHTGNAVATVTRLGTSASPSYVIASAVNGILAQRLVRGICQHCKKPSSRPRPTSPVWQPDEYDQARMLRRRRLRDVQRQRLQGPYRRLRDPDVLAAIRELVSVDASEPQIRREALAEGMQTLLMATLNKVRAGKTTLAELFRVIELDEVDRASADECPSCGVGDRAGLPGVPGVRVPSGARLSGLRPEGAGTLEGVPLLLHEARSALAQAASRGAGSAGRCVGIGRCENHESAAQGWRSNAGRFALAASLAGRPCAASVWQLLDFDLFVQHEHLHRLPLDPIR